jgi:hypothetical protein
MGTIKPHWYLYFQWSIAEGIMSYLIRNEDDELMRVVARQEEAIAICALRNGWTFKCVRKPVKKVDLSQFEEALI